MDESTIFVLHIGLGSASCSFSYMTIGTPRILSAPKFCANRVVIDTWQRIVWHHGSPSLKDGRKWWCKIQRRVSRSPFLYGCFTWGGVKEDIQKVHWVGRSGSFYMYVLAADCLRFSVHESGDYKRIIQIYDRVSSEHDLTTLMTVP